MTRHEKPCWRSVQQKNFTNIDKFADYLQLDDLQRKMLNTPAKFIVNVPLRLAEKMAKRTLDDPLTRQFLPLHEENKAFEGFALDPVGDAKFGRTSKLLHKYQGRALLVCTSACAMHCRYCFRQNYDYEKNDKSFAKELAMIAEDPSLQEIILSGGDPLSLSDQTLKSLLDGLSAIPHIRRIRFHSRFLVGIPERIDDSFIELLDAYAFTFWFVVHINHPREIDLEVGKAIKRLLKLGIPVLNQAVLLKGVNDSVDVQRQLCESLINHGVFPYYLHQLDRVQGASHFEVEECQGRRILEELRTSLPGYGVPQYVKEICGEAYKTPLMNT